MMSLLLLLASASSALGQTCRQDDSKCSSSGNDCCACDTSIGQSNDCGWGRQEPATCRDGYVPIITYGVDGGRHNRPACEYSCYPPGCTADDVRADVFAADFATADCTGPTSREYTTPANQDQRAASHSECWPFQNGGSLYGEYCNFDVNAATAAGHSLQREWMQRHSNRV